VKPVLQLIARFENGFSGRKAQWNLHMPIMDCQVDSGDGTPDIYRYIFKKRTNPQ
jgi:hypothetical protein